MLRSLSGIAAERQLAAAGCFAPNANVLSRFFEDAIIPPKGRRHRRRGPEAGLAATREKRGVASSPKYHDGAFIALSRGFRLVSEADSVRVLSPGPS